MFSGKVTGRFSAGILTISFFELYAIGIGHPQYLCLDTPQSFSLKLIFFFPSFLFSKISIVFKTDSSGYFRPSRNFELNKIPLPVYASEMT